MHIENRRKKIFRLVHDENHHFEVHRCYERIFSIFYISRLFRKLRRYIEHCFNCQLTQTKRHRFYEKLISINSSFYSFHIIVLNFIVALPDELNAIFDITCKHFRRVSLMIDKIIYNVNE